MRPLKRVDDAIAAVERLLIVALLGVMALAVFFDALHRIFSAREGRLERLLVWLAPAGAESAVRGALAPVLLGAATLAIVYAALRTMERPLPLTPRGALLRAVGITALAAGATQALVRGLPGGLVWSQQMALCFMLWVGLLGASLATRDRAHIAFELAHKLWPGGARRPVELLARTGSAAFCAFLSVLAVAFARGNFEEWQSSGHAAGLFEGFHVPRFTIYGFLPVPFAVMAFRFLLYGVHAPAEDPPR